MCKEWNILELLTKAIHIIISFLFVLGWLLFFITIRQKGKRIRLYIFNVIKKNWRELYWCIHYIGLLCIATIFVIRNMDKCLSMSFFSKFDGYNIVWIGWLVLLFMPLISVDNKWFKIPNPMSKAQKEVEKEKENMELEKKKSVFIDLSSK